MTAHFPAWHKQSAEENVEILEGNINVCHFRLRSFRRRNCWFSNHCILPSMSIIS